MAMDISGKTPKRLRSTEWFSNPDNDELTELYVARYRNYGLSRQELQSGRPVIGIAQTGSDLAPCNRHHIDLAKRTKEGIREAGGIPMEFPVHPIQETCRRPTAALDRNLSYLGLVEILHGYPLDGVVITGGCDKTTPAGLMAAATMDLPAIVLSGGPMLNGWLRGERIGSGNILFKARKLLAEGRIEEAEYHRLLAASAPSIGHCNTMGTALTMNVLAEALGMSLPGCAAIPAPYRERAEMAFHTGRRIVELVREDIKPSDIMTREAFENAIVVNSAIGGSTNAPVHIIAIARHLGIDLSLDDWKARGQDVPLLVNMLPAGAYLGEEFYRAGGLPAVVHELARAGLLHDGTTTVGGATLVEAGEPTSDPDVIRPVSAPLMESAGLVVLTGNFFDRALMKVSGIPDDFRARFLSDPADPRAFEGNAVVFEGPEDYAARIDRPEEGIDERSILVMRGAGPVGYPGSGEVVNMRPPAHLLKRGIDALPCMGDGRQSGTTSAPSILNMSPEAAIGGGLALLRTGDRIRVDLNANTVDVLIGEDELARRRQDAASSGKACMPESHTPWEEIQRGMVEQLSEGMVLTPALKYRKVAATCRVPRTNY